jgi:hypothetical protein
LARAHTRRIEVEHLAGAPKNRDRLRVSIFLPQRKQKKTEENRVSLNCAIFLRLRHPSSHFLSICHVAAAVYCPARPALPCHPAGSRPPRNLLFRPGPFHLSPSLTRELRGRPSQPPRLVPHVQPRASHCPPAARRLLGDSVAARSRPIRAVLQHPLRADGPSLAKPLLRLRAGWRQQGRGEDWAGELAIEDVDATTKLRRCTYAGRPFGSESLVKAISQRFGRCWTRGRPKKEQTSGAASSEFANQFALF